MKHIKTFEGFGSLISGIKDRFKKRQDDARREKERIRKEKEDHELVRRNKLKDIDRKIKSNLPDIISILQDEDLYIRWQFIPSSGIAIEIAGMFSKKLSPADSVSYRNKILKESGDLGDVIYEVVERVEDMGFNLSNPFYGSGSEREFPMLIDPIYIHRLKYMDRNGLYPIEKEKLEYIKYLGGGGRDRKLGDILDGVFYPKHNEMVYLFFSLPPTNPV